MLDLNKMENKLDEQLAKETDESLSQQLKQKRGNDMGTIAIDFDGVIHKYSKGWQDGNIYDEPNVGAIKALNTLLEKEYVVFVFSTRSARQIKKWLIKHSNPLLYMTESEFLDRYLPLQPYDAEFIKSYYENKALLQFPIKVIPFWQKFWNKKEVVGITKKKLPAHIYIDDRCFKFTDWKTALNEILK